MRPTLALLLATAVACGACGMQGKPEKPQHLDRGDDETTDTPFGAAANFKPKSFSVEVTGKGGRPIIFIPGLGCPGLVWNETVAHLGDDYEAHVLTLAGFAGEAPIKEPLSAAVRRDLTRYIRSHKLKNPIIVGHSMGGFIAYWLASYHPELVGPTIIVDAGPALSGDMEEAKQLRARWRREATDEELADLMRAVFSQMTIAPKKMEPVIAAVIKSDRRSMGDAIYEMIATDLTDKMKDITAPVLIVAADGWMQGRIRAQVEGIPDHELIVLPKTHHFVMFDDPDGFFKVVDKFLDAHPAK